MGKLLVFREGPELCNLCSFLHLLCLPQITLLSLTRCSVYSPQNWLQGSQMTLLLLTIHKAASFDFCSLSPCLSHLPLHQWHAPGFIFILYLLTLLAHIPTENVFFLYRLWPWLFSVFLSEVLESLGIWEAEWERANCGENLQLHSQRPSSVCLESSPHPPFQLYPHTLAAMLCHNFEGNVCWHRKIHLHQILPSHHS